MGEYKIKLYYRDESDNTMGNKNKRLSAIDLIGGPILESFKAYHEGITITDDNGRVLFMNEVQLRMDDFTQKDTLGKPVSALYSMDEGHSPTLACLKTGKVSRNLAVYYRTHLGRLVNSIHNVYPVIIGDKVAGAVCCITDFKNLEHSFDTVMDLKTSSSHPYQMDGRRSNGTRYSFTDIIGRCREIVNAIKTAKRASKSDSSVLIYGKTGTGKELFAQSIHNHSARKHHPFLAINCATIPENLLEGLLFGTAKGAFTGSVDKAGLFERADGGTVLLDEINSMPVCLQAKILRFLQERKIRRIGSMGEISIDLKILSTINVSPQDAVETNALRPDLYYRLAVVVIHIPPLKDRGNDLELLADHFLSRKTKNFGWQTAGFSTDVRNFFKTYDWPGNVRQLEHLIEGAVNLAGSDRVLEMHHLPEAFPAAIGQGNGGPSRPEQLFSQSTGEAPKIMDQSIKTQGKTLAELKVAHEISILTSELQATRGNAARAARNLGISPQMMNYKLNRLNIKRKNFI